MSTFRLVGPVPREHPLQRTIAKVLALELAPAGRLSPKGVCWFAIEHANYAGSVPERAGRGVVAGIPDTFVLHRGKAHFIEVKADDGELRETQQEMAAAILGAGGRVGVARDAAEVLQCLDEWQIPRHGRVKGLV